MTLQKNKTAKQRWLDELYTPAVKKRAEPDNPTKPAP